jgi:hypothetical protein
MEAIDSKTDLCSTCIYEVPTCEGFQGTDLEFGDGVGNDNIIKCDFYEKRDE